MLWFNLFYIFSLHIVNFDFDFYYPRINKDTYINLLTNEFGKNNIGLYRDDGLSCFQNISGPDSERIKK